MVLVKYDVVNMLYNAICYKLSTIKCHLVPGLPYITLHNHQLNCLFKVHSKVQILFFPNIHSKSDKVCGLCFSVSKICGKSVQIATKNFAKKMRKLRQKKAKINKKCIKMNKNA